MTYRELLKLYRDGKLPEEQRLAVERDIEKQDAISDYLYEEAFPAEETPPEEADGEILQTDDVLLCQIRRAVRRSLLRVGAIAGAVALIGVLLAVFLLPKAVSLFYYDPTEVPAEEEGVLFPTNRMSLDLAVYSELYLPGSYRDRVIAEPEGWGRYSLIIPQTASPDGRMISVGGRLCRNELLLYDPDFLKAPGSNLFLPPEGIDPMLHFIDGSTGKPFMPQGTWKEAQKKLDGLSDTDFYVGYISLDQVMDYASFYRWFSDKGLNLSFAWCAVHAEDENGHALLHNAGFHFASCGTSLTWDREAYPLLSLYDSDGWSDPGDAEAMQTHFISMLRYVRDFPQLTEMLTGQRADHLPGFPERVAAALERDGLRTYGFSVTARKETFLALRDDPLVSYIYVQPLR